MSHVLKRPAPTRQGHKIENLSGQRYWEKFSQHYPYQLSVPYLSHQDIDPNIVKKLITQEFMRVPFNNQTHWGFRTAKNLQRFQMIVLAADK